MERAVADLPTYKAGDAADLSELIQSWRVGASQTAPEGELGMGTGDPTAWSRVIVNLFKAGDTAARELQGIWYQRKMFTNMLRKHGVPSAPARGSGGVQK
jgi:hypothetical protein